MEKGRDERRRRNSANYTRFFATAVSASETLPGGRGLSRLDREVPWRVNWQTLPASVNEATLPVSVTESTARRYELQDPDVRLMLAVRDGNAEAFDELMLRYQNRVITVLTHLTGQQDLAEDLAQDVFLRIYRSRKRYAAGAKFSTWLFTIVNRVAVNALRSQSRRPEINLEARASGPMGANPLEQMALAASGMLPTRSLDKAELHDVVRSALDNLNERQRMAVLLNKFEGMSYAEIATTMELSTEAVKSLLTRARLKLRDVLEPYLEEGNRTSHAGDNSAL